MLVCVVLLFVAIISLCYYRHVVLCYATVTIARILPMLLSLSLFFVMLCYVMLCYVTPCHSISFLVIALPPW